MVQNMIFQVSVPFCKIYSNFHPIPGSCAMFAVHGVRGGGQVGAGAGVGCVMEEPLN